MKLFVLGLATVLAASVLVSAGSAAPPQRPEILTAVISQHGDLVYGIGAVSARHASADGEFFVTFDRDVSHCTAIAGAGDYIGDGYAGPDDGVTFGTAPADNDANSIFVAERDEVLGYESDSTPWQLIVVCG